MGNAWQGKKNRQRSAIDGLSWAAMNDPVFTGAVEFDEGADELFEGEARICRRDCSALEIVRRVSMSVWDGYQDQLMCPICSTKYVQFVSG